MTSPGTPSRSFPSADSAPGRVRALWARRTHPVIADIVTPEILADEDRLADTLAADAEERRKRGESARVETYAASIPDLLNKAAACRALLMSELVARRGEPSEHVKSDLLRRLPALASEIEVVMSLASLLEDAAAEELPPRETGAKLGKYVLEELLGRGAFGEVWQAWDAELERHLALKILHNAHHSGTRGVQRFLSEVRAAASLDHEAVVRVHASGQFSETGEYFIDSQLVADAAPTPVDAKGVKVGESLDRRMLQGPMPPREAARLLARAARGVAAAHARGITHRDLKPSNIIVTPSGRPLVTDFGLSTSGVLPRDEARGTSDGQGDRAKAGRIVGTPAYMSPEQARGEVATPLSDVFALGATLRALLTGKPLYEPSNTAKTDTGNVSRAGDVGSLGDRSAARREVIEMAQRASLQPLALIAPNIPGTLAAICDKATSADPADRYHTAEHFAADLEAFLTHRPTLAAPPGKIRATGMWCRRNALATGIAIAAAIVIIVGTIVFINRVITEKDLAVAAQLEASSQRDEAVKARDTLETINQFLPRTLNSAVGRDSSRDITVRSAIELASSRIGHSFADQPLAEAGVRHILGQAAMAVADYAESRRQFDIALQIRAKELGPEARETLFTRRQMGELLRLQGKRAEAEEIFTEILEPLRRVVGPDDPNTLRALGYIGGRKRTNGDLPEARRILEEAAAGFARAKQYGAADRQGIMDALVLVYRDLRMFDEMETVQRDIVAMNQKLLGPDDISTLNAMYGLGALLRQARRDADAEPVLRDVIDKYRATVGHSHVGTMTASLMLGDLLIDTKHNLDEAEALARDVIAGAKANGTGTSMEIRGLTLLGRVAIEQGNTDQAIAAMKDAFELGLTAKGDNTRWTRDAGQRLVRLYQQSGRKSEADAIRRRIPAQTAPAPTKE